MKLIPETRMKKEQFLIEHNKLSPKNLQTTFAMLTRFQEEKKPKLRDNEWSNKLRIPFISWLLTFPPAPEPDEENNGKTEKQEYKIYPKPV